MHSITKENGYNAIRCTFQCNILLYFLYLKMKFNINELHLKMKFNINEHTLLFLLLSIVSVLTNDIESCEKDGLSCSTDNGRSSSTLLKVKNWWNEMSVQKPIKCKTPSYWIHQSPVLAAFSKLHPVISFPCIDVKYFYLSRSRFM